MRAAVYRAFGGPEVVRVENVPTPQPGPHDVLIRVHASTVSAADHRARSRRVPAGLGLLAGIGIGFLRPSRRILGMDVAGIVEAVGSQVTTFAAGDEVIAMLGGRFGGHAEYVTVPAAGAITRKPRTMSFEESVSIVFGGITALAFLDQVRLRPGASVLVNGASGAVGISAVQLARALGARVTAVSSVANAELVASLGARHVVDYAVTDFAGTGSRYDVIMDCVGNAPYRRVASSLAPGGALLLVVADLASMLGAARHSRASGALVTATVGPWRATGLARLVALAETGQLEAVIDRSYGLDDIVQAHGYVDTGRKRGSVVLAFGRDATPAR